jgi:iron complex outermembrane receptor protein
MVKMAKVLICSIIAIAFFFPCAVRSQETEKAPNVKLEEIVVKEKETKEFVEIDPKSLTTQETIPKEMINTLLNEAQTGSYKALNMLPSANVQTGDAYGLALGKTLRLRGAFSGDSFLRNIEGLPVSSHGGGGDFIDFENIQNISIFRGAIPTARGFGVRNMTGGMDLSILWPEDKFGGMIKQSLGTSNFRRTFLRVDSGLLPSGTKFFGSYSTTSADNWRGEGGQPESRDNFEMGVSQKLGKNAKLDIFGVYHELKQNDLRGLTYDQAQHLCVYGKFDYNRRLTGNAAQDQQYYYDFTRQVYRDIMFLANFETKLPGDTKLTLKPYYWNDKGHRWSGSSTGVGIGDPTTQPQQYGFVAQYDFSIKPVDLSIGYWNHTAVDGLPPPLGSKRYVLSYAADGSARFTYAGWSSLSKVSNKTYNAPYMTAQTTLGKTTFMGSLKYTYIKDPSRRGYSTTGLPDVTYEKAFDYNPPVDPETTTRSRLWRFWEPGFSVNHEFTKDMNAYFAYGTGYEFNNWSGLSSSYTNNKAKFKAAGISFNSLWNKLDIERFDNFDLGFRYKGKMFGIAPTVYYSLDKNKMVSVYDPVVGASYQQSDANATSYGAELEITAQPPIPVPGDLTLYLSGSYNHYTYNDDIRNASSNIVRSKGKQIADTPEYMAKFGATYSIQRLSITPMARYIGTRYGDVENKEKVGSYVVADLYMSYHTGRVWAMDDVRFNLSVLNLFNKRYIGNINTSDFTVSNSTSYYPGAPLTVMGGITIKF